jgi:hypothetical protein
LLCALSAFAATSKSVSCKSGDDTVQALIYKPEGKGPFPGILVIHEWWGLNDWVKEQASKLSDLGYVALADRGIPVEDAKKFEQTMKQLGKKVEIVICPNAGHAFENPNNKAGYRPDDAADGFRWQSAECQVLRSGFVLHRLLCSKISTCQTVLLWLLFTISENPVGCFLYEHR